MIIFNSESGEFVSLNETTEKNYYCIFAFDPDENLSRIDDQAPFVYDSMKELIAALASKTGCLDLTDYIDNEEMVLVIRKIKAIDIEK